MSVIFKKAVWIVSGVLHSLGTRTTAPEFDPPLSLGRRQMRPVQGRP